MKCVLCPGICLKNHRPVLRLPELHKGFYSHMHIFGSQKHKDKWHAATGGLQAGRQRWPMASYPRGGLGVVVDEEGAAVRGDAHLPARGQEALGPLVLGLGGVVGGRLWGLRVGQGVLHCPAHRRVLHALRSSKQHHCSPGTCETNPAWLHSKRLLIPDVINSTIKCCD